MADNRPLFYTLRKHKKKCIAAGIAGLWAGKYAVDKFREYLVRRELCYEAKVYGDETTPALKKPRRLTVFLNPRAGNGDAVKLYEKNAAPILHLAGLDVTVVKLDYEGQSKTLLQYIDPTVDGIVVAGGDGTVLEVVTGLLRRSDQEKVKKIPIGVIPIGQSNSLARRLQGESKGLIEARCIGNAALAIVEGKTQPVDTMEIKGEEGKSTFAFSHIHWGAFRNAKASTQRFWFTGFLKKKVTYIANTFQAWPPQYSITVSGGESDAKSEHLVGISVVPVHDENSSGLEVVKWSPSMTRQDFISLGWRMDKTDGENDINSELKNTERAPECKITPHYPQSSWYTIDGDDFEAQPVSVKVHRDNLNFFVSSRIPSNTS